MIRAYPGSSVRRRRLGLVALLVVLVGGLVFGRRLIGGRADPYARERMSEMVEIRCAETDREWAVVRGQLEAELRARPGQLDVTQGLASRFAEGRRTGFPVDPGLWSETIARINGEKAALVRSRGRGRGVVGGR